MGTSLLHMPRQSKNTTPDQKMLSYKLQYSKLSWSYNLTLFQLLGVFWILKLKNQRRRDFNHGEGFLGQCQLIWTSTRDAFNLEQRWKRYHTTRRKWSERNIVFNRLQYIIKVIYFPFHVVEIKKPLCIGINIVTLDSGFN